MTHKDVLQVAQDATGKPPRLVRQMSHNWSALVPFESSALRPLAHCTMSGARPSGRSPLRVFGGPGFNSTPPMANSVAIVHNKRKQRAQGIEIERGYNGPWASSVPRGINRPVGTKE